MKKIKIKIIVIIALTIICVAFIGALLIYKEKITLNYPSDMDYPISGIDVSHYQGEIDWNVMEDQNMDFAFIKATEGSSSVDECFNSNWEKAQESELVIGAYHFFSFDSSAMTQAENFIHTVGNLDGKLPPVIDFEYYGNKEKNPPDIDNTRKELKTMLDLLEKHYDVKPILYVTYKTYIRYIKGEFADYPLWIRNVYYSPNIDMKGKWMFWQYTDTAVLRGYSGAEKYIDRNVFRGTEDEFLQLLID